MAGRRGGSDFEDWGETIADLDPYASLETGTALDSSAADAGRDSTALGLTLAQPLPAPPTLDRGPGLGPTARTIIVPASPGQVVAGRYQIEDALGEGGMGHVWRVRHVRLTKAFALKQIHSDLAADPALRERFYSEARLASSLSHPNIISIVDFGEDPLVGAFMVMELAEGESLSSRRRQVGRLRIRTAVEVVRQVAAALRYIHARDIVHGDIKPDNILIKRSLEGDGRRWHVILLDFGLARARTKTTDQSTDAIEGTPAYMAPERLRGGVVGPGGDIYGLGVMMYELIAGRLPFDGEPSAVLHAHLHDAPPPLAAMTPEPLDERLEGLVMRALSKDPAARHPTMEAFLYELDTVADMLGIAARSRRGRPVRGTTQQAGDGLAALALAAFTASSVAMAVVTGKGEIAGANPAFAWFLTGDHGARVAGVPVLDPRITRLYPAIADDLAAVARTGERATRPLAFWSARRDRSIEFVAVIERCDDDRLLLSLLPQLAG